MELLIDREGKTAESVNGLIGVVVEREPVEAK